MSMFNRFRSKQISSFLLITFLYELLFPSVSLALTGGPSQPEVETFAQVSTNDMVDLFTGDFSYNIPLIDVGGYPLNLIYNSNPTLDQEASWVGLGWNINPGSITRNMRGLPDDFKGDAVEKEYKIKDNKSWGVDVGVQFKLLGLKLPKKLMLGVNLGLSANNYKGYGMSLGVSPALSASKSGYGSKSASLGLQFSTQDGLSISAEANMSTVDKKNSFESGVGLSYNTRAGMKELSMSRKSSTADKPDLNTSAASISFGSPTFTPTMNMPLHNNSYTMQGTVGGELWGLHGNIAISGFWSKQTLVSPFKSARSYGYLNSEIGSADISSLMDFNREKDISYNKAIPALPIPNFTYDLFNASGQGISGQFRAHRSDIGVLFDNYTQSGSSSLNAGIQLGTGNLIHSGGNINQVSVATTSKKWNTENSLLPNADFSGTVAGNHLYESGYFKQSGDLSLKDDAFYNSIGNSDPVDNALVPKVTANLPSFRRLDQATNTFAQGISVNRKMVKSKREKRGQLFSYLNADEATYVGLDRSILSYVLDSIPYSKCKGGLEFLKNKNFIDRTSHPAHHISEISITKMDGKKYVYGIPAYNNVQRDVTFACKDSVVDPLDGLITYNPGVDDSKSNTLGVDNYYSSEKMPAYAYAYLLSGVLSPDYVDRTGNGISNDDIGEATKFNYTRVTDSYNWRIPYQENKASFNSGLMAGNGAFNSSCGGDAKGSYTFGTKELWYVHSIESRTMVAMFYLADREDGLGVKGVHGGHSLSPGVNERQKLLKEIRLFSKSDLLKYGDSAVPVKTVHLVYDYSRCPDVPNNTNATINNNGNAYSYYVQDPNVNANHGKLTLRKVYFTYGSNTKGQLSSYQFSYNNFNPSYGMKNYDRWGNYKDNSSANLNVSNAEFPYTLQDTTFTNNYSRAYNLESIDLPSGGRVSVQLESDDYAYVQDRRAGQMHFIEGFTTLQSGTTTLNTPGNLLYDGSTVNNIIVLNVGDNTGDIISKYLTGIDELFYRMNIDLGHSSQYDYMSGYAKIDKSGDWYGTHSSNCIWVKLKNFKNDYHAISHDGWQYLKNNLPELAYPGSSDPGNNLGDAIIGLISSFGDIITMIQGFNDHAVKRKWAKKIKSNKSWVRLNNGDFHKLGGGSRVKKITINDNWDNMAPSGVGKEYGQEYFYSDTSNGRNQSTGVAIWEPNVGGDENPLKQPVRYEVKRPMIENDHYYMEEPFGESFFPAPVVGYSQVLVASTSNEHITRTATGHTINQFYTARDYPIFTGRTDPESRKLKPPFKLSFLGSAFSKEKWLVSQGYSVELNDMHGKQKATKIYNSMGHEISSVYYYYKTENFKGRNRITPKADVIQPDGVIVQNVPIAEDIDFCMDMRQQETDISGIGADINFESMILPLGFIPLFIIIPPIIPKITKENVQFRSAVGMKVSHRTGILDRVVATKDGSTIQTENICYDAETGEVLLTKTQNDFSDPVFDWTYPAHWAYRNMRPAYTNAGVTLRNVQVSNGIVSDISAAYDCFAEGDKILVIVNGIATDVTLTVGTIYSGSLRLFKDNVFATVKDVNDNLITCDLKVIEPGRKNMSSISVGNLTTLHSPPIDSTNPSSLKFAVTSNTKILQANALEYNDKWKINCTDLTNLECETARPNICLDNFINLVLNYNQTHSTNLFKYPCHGMTVGDLYRTCNCQCQPDTINGQDVDEMRFGHWVTCGKSHDYRDTVKNSGWLFGNCVLLMNTLSGNAINIDSLQIIEPLGTDSSWTKVYVGVNHTDSVSFNLECKNCIVTCESPTMNDSVLFNPYLSGMLNNWHPYKTWNYDVGRLPATGTARVRTGGPFASYSPFWNYSALYRIWQNTGPSNDDKWVNASTTTRINRLGAEIENKNVLNNYSAALYGYNLSLAKAISSNSRNKQIANDNFEDYQYRSSCQDPCEAEHWNFVDDLDSNHRFITDTVAHSGMHSLFVDSSYSAMVYREIMYKGEDSLFTRNLNLGAYYLHNGCMERFSPDSGRYVISGWVREPQLCGQYGYVEDSVEVYFTGASEQFAFYPTGVVVEGWQRFEGIFDVPSTATGIIVKLHSGSKGAYFDDLRLHPYHANMKSFVYNPRSLKLMAELDENNYATFYEYNDEGLLVRVKKETERGIMTLKESRSAYKRQ